MEKRHREFLEGSVGSRYFSGHRTDSWPHQGYPEMALPCKNLKNVTFRYSVEEPSKNRLDTSFFLLKINYPKAVPNKRTNKKRQNKIKTRVGQGNRLLKA